MLQYDRLDRESIMQSLTEGRYYSSLCPLIKQIIWENNIIYAETSPAHAISFISDTFFDRDRVYTQNTPITEAYYHLTDMDRAIRIEVTDIYGKKDWSNFIKVKYLKLDF